MNRLFRLVALATPMVLIGLPLQAASPESPIPLNQGSMGTWNADWDDIANRTYFFQWSFNLVDGHYMPIVEYGIGAKSYGFSSSSDKYFVRLQQAFEPSSDPEGDDYDYDGLSNIDEVTLYDTNPLDWDTDGDGLPDDWEIANGFDPRDDGSIDPANGVLGDPDEDGLSNIDEYYSWTDPHVADTDGDGASDLAEGRDGSNPNSSTSTPNNPGGTPGGPANPPPPIVSVQVNFGDHSGSHSEKYRVLLEPLEGDANTQKRYRTNRKYGETQTETFMVPAGAKYKVTLTHIGTDPKYRDDPNPDYDYTLEFTSPANTDPAIAIIPENPVGMLGVHDESYTYFADGKDATLYTAWLSSETFATIPSDRKRTKLGVGEEVSLNLKPVSLPTANWSLSGNIGTSALTNPGNTGAVFNLLKLGNRKCAPTSQVKINDSILKIDFEVVQPDGERSDSNTPISYPSGTQGAGMQIEVTTLPNDVSFYNVEVIEVDKGTQNIKGYFGHVAIADLNHEPYADWLVLTPQNKWPQGDKAAFHGWEIPWSYGTYEWAIEVRWRIPSQESGQGEVLGNRIQTHTIVDTTGKCTETKSFGTTTATTTRTP